MGKNGNSSATNERLQH